ncbi:hypothetical protein HMPREF1043_2199 [Streptococcus anginosus subsp. whileyi CCUG 39159]|uniref:SP-0191-like C-terminal domain-containing protein n=1 Tax=Streptococcus anginosus subsp. whileyi CCUG 39159 TaxID=1095729 RepID=I0S7P8_STRAP|nr:SP0191 family lipoprotein [Streptococcus anginosus]AGU84398.1 hypothetical protein SANR_2012 [Streptococcus anginosus C238]EID19401.1 hypothetical protein HMPREF1043_2199 [Streptococcus anginosus subsp. whileyi CCUG 39159]
MVYYSYKALKYKEDIFIRKSVVLLGASLLLLTACGQKSGQNQSGDSKTGSSVVKKDSVVTKSFQQKQTVQGIEQTLPENMKSVLAGQDLESTKPHLISAFEKAAGLDKFKSLGGVDVKTDITKDYIIKVTINIDMSKINLDEASKLDTYGSMFSTIKNLTPKQYIESVKAAGAKEVANP